MKINSKPQVLFSFKQSMIILSVAIFFLSHSVSSLNTENVIVAINCGGDSYEDNEGVQYEADNYYNTGNPSDYGLQYDIDLTKDEELYQTERWADRDLVYSIPFDVEEGKYVVILKFSEVYFTQAGEKVFDIAIGSKMVIKNLDIFDNVGKAKAHDEYIEFEIKKDGYLYYKVSVFNNIYLYLLIYIYIFTNLE